MTTISTTTVLRKSDDAPTFLDDFASEIVRAGTTYAEYAETWEHDRGDGSKRLVSRSPTGRRFEYECVVDEDDEDAWGQAERAMCRRDAMGQYVAVDDCWLVGCAGGKHKHGYVVGDDYRTHRFRLA